MPSRPDISIPAGLATATLVFALYNRGLPSSADMRATEEGENKLESVRKQNAWMAAATVGGISLIAKDPAIFLMGGAMVVALDWMTRTNIWTNPITNSARQSENNIYGRGDMGETSAAETMSYDTSDLGVVA